MNLKVTVCALVLIALTIGVSAGNVGCRVEPTASAASEAEKSMPVASVEYVEVADQLDDQQLLEAERQLELSLAVARDLKKAAADMAEAAAWTERRQR